MALMLWASIPLTPFTLNVLAPKLAEVAAQTCSVEVPAPEIEDGEKAAVIPGAKPGVLRVTVLVKPLTFARTLTL